MFKFDNTHIFTGYLKQMLSSLNLPTCKIYTKEFAEYYAEHGREDPRVVESFDSIRYVYDKNSGASKARAATRISYLKGNEPYSYFLSYNQNKEQLVNSDRYWKKTASLFYDCDKSIPGLTKVLNSPGSLYDTTTHEYLGEYLRFIRDYYDIDLMSMYNCFNNKIYNNIFYTHKAPVVNPDFDSTAKISASNQQYLYSDRTFDSRDSKYRIYAFPVKLFSNYTVAIDCDHEIEMFCGLYKTTLDTSEKSKDLIAKTYKKVNRMIFKQPILYDKLSVNYWNYDTDTSISADSLWPRMFDNKAMTRWDILNREQDLKLFIKIPASCKSSIVVLEGDFRGFNDYVYKPVRYNSLNNQQKALDTNADSTSMIWEYKQNHAVINFKAEASLNTNRFRPIGKLQLLTFNTGESYPFSDRLVEYLSNSAITPIDQIADNIQRAQKVMTDNKHHFRLAGRWENKMQRIVYDYLINPLPTIIGTDASGNAIMIDKRSDYHKKLGYTAKSTLYDVLGYVDKDAEKWYASWTTDKGKDGLPIVRNNIQNVDIYVVDGTGKSIWDI